jgi:hypothetical protein
MQNDVEYFLIYTNIYNDYAFSSALRWNRETDVPTQTLNADFRPMDFKTGYNP